MSIQLVNLIGRHLSANVLVEIVDSDKHVVLISPEEKVQAA